MTLSTPKRLYLFVVGIMPEYNIPIVCYLLQTADGRNILIDSGLPAVMPEGETDFENTTDVLQQLKALGFQAADIDTVISTHYDIDHAGRHGSFTNARFIVQRAHHSAALAGDPRFAALRDQWEQPLERIQLIEGDTEVLPGLQLIDTTGHVVGHQSVLLRLPKTGSLLLTIDAVSFADGFTRDLPAESDNPDAAAVHASTIKLMDIAEQQHIGLVIFGHDVQQWSTLKTAPEYYE